MPAIAPIEDLRAAQEELLAWSLVFITNALRFTPNGKKSERG